MGKGKVGISLSIIGLDLEGLLKAVNRCAQLAYSGNKLAHIRINLA